MKKILIIFIFYGLHIFASDALFCVANQHVKSLFPLVIVGSNDIFLKIFSFVIPGSRLLNHSSERMVEDVFELMQYRPISTSWRDALDEYIIDSITLKQMHRKIVYGNAFSDEAKFFEHFQIYLEMPFLKRFGQFHQTQAFLVSCYLKMQELVSNWNRLSGHMNQYKPAEELVKNGIILKFFYVFLDEREFVLWKRLFEIGMESNSDNDQCILKTLFAYQYCDYIKQYGKIGAFFDQYHDEFVFLKSNNKIITPITLEDTPFFYLDDQCQLEEINKYIDKYKWLSNCICNNLLLTFTDLSRKYMSSRDLICKLLNKIEFNTPCLKMSTAKKFLQMLTLLNKQLTQQSEERPKYIISMKNRQFYPYFIHQFYYNLVQLFRAGCIIEYKQLADQSDIMKRFFSECNAFFNYYCLDSFLKTLLKSNVTYYLNQASHDQTSPILMPIQKAQKKQQLNIMFHGFKLMMLYSFLSSINNQHSFDETYKDTFKKFCASFLKHTDGKMASFLRKYFK